MEEKYIEKSGDNSGINTVLLIIILLIIVGGVVWYVAYHRGAVTQTPANGLNVQVNVPTGGNTGNTPSGSANPY